ncbi:N5-glutamine methyltransferase family protein [Corynebacterium marinum]|uniref:Release factor glutamine methyltransferase n=1 Tax=Corynebacterium marinum DSM 44953 TaxID=1224162 RepID=A0A0B6TSP9_9CORY|nr:HemK/PrmC family methyltransferase [Corynebacterium marinum]AJK68625.1 Release factor glutamine methyltransferase [Corynebacterium marinum DSM 44953]GGO14289.1 release factor glutamine methyltransferase [Corynebacterium marinum]
MTPRRTLRESLVDAAERFASAGVPSPEVDARLIAAHLLKVGPMEVALHSRGEVPGGFEEMVARRERREPLQHILGVAPFGPLDLEVGPGVFIPRPETEVLADWGVRQLMRAGVRPGRPARVVDLCTGTGALALYVAEVFPGGVEVIGVEKHDEALAYARRNAAGTAVTVVRGDVTDPALLADWHGTVDLVLSNPPYVPETPDLDTEVYADPPQAVFAGESGMEVIHEMLPTVAALLRPGGLVGIEHDDTTSQAVLDALTAHGGFGGAAVLHDLTGRARFATASKLSD